MKSTVTPLRGRRVLFVEDNAINRAIARSFFRERELRGRGRIQRCAGARQALRACSRSFRPRPHGLAGAGDGWLRGGAAHPRDARPAARCHSDRDDDGQCTGAGLIARARLRRVAAFIKAHRLDRPARGAVRGPARKLTTNRNPSNEKYAVESSTAYFSFLETAYFAIAR